MLIINIKLLLYNWIIRNKKTKKIFKNSIDKSGLLAYNKDNKNN